MQNKNYQDKNPKELRILQIVIGVISTIISGLIISDLEVIPIAVLKEESILEIIASCI